MASDLRETQDRHEAAVRLARRIADAKDVSATVTWGPRVDRYGYAFGDDVVDICRALLAREAQTPRSRRRGRMSDSNRPRGECQHGQLARQCELCEKDATIAEQAATIARLEGERDEAVQEFEVMNARLGEVIIAKAQAEAERDALRARVNELEARPVITITGTRKAEFTVEDDE